MSLRKIIITDSCFISGTLADIGKTLEVQHDVAIALIQTGRARFATDADAKPVVETAEGLSCDGLMS